MKLISRVRTCLCDCVAARCCTLTCTWGSRLCQPVWPGVWEEAWATELGCCLSVTAAGWCPDSFLGQELRVLEDRSLRNTEGIRGTPEPININNKKICINVNADFSLGSVHVSARLLLLEVIEPQCEWEEKNNKHSDVHMCFERDQWFRSLYFKYKFM